MKPNLRRALVAVAVLAALGIGVFGYRMARAGQDLRVNGILAFEFAGTPANARAIMEVWGETGQAAARRSLLNDVGYILFGYAPLIAALCLLFSRRRGRGKPRPAGQWWAIAALVAGALDLVENAALWGVLARPLDPGAFWTGLAAAAAAVKFALVVPAAVYALLGLGEALARVTPLVNWFLGYPLLFLPAVLVIAIVWRFALVSLGIPDLFWDENGWAQLAAGIGVGALLAHLGVMGFLLDTRRAGVAGVAYRARWSSRLPIAWLVDVLPSVKEGPVLLSGYLVRAGLPLVGLAVAGVLMSPGGVAPWWLPFGTVAGFLVYAGGAVVLADDVVTETLWAPDAVRRRIAAERSFPGLHRLAYHLLVLQLALYAVLFVLYRVFDQGVYVGLALCVVLAGIASAYGYLKYFFPGRTFGVLTAFVAAYVTVNAFGGHHLPFLDYYRRTGVRDYALHPADHLLPPLQHLAAWKARRASERPPLVVLAVDGGGIRAAVWATVVMNQLARDVPGFPYFVRVVTGASGGMVGMASYVGSLQPPEDPRRHVDLENTEVSPDLLITRVATDSLATMVRDLVFKDLAYPPIFHPRSDRGLALERSWEANTRIVGQPFAALLAGEKDGWRPSLVVSPFLVEDGRRLLISNLDLEALDTIPVSAEHRSLQAVEYFRMIERHPGAVAAGAPSRSLRLGTAARMNASFPWVSPAAELPTDPPRHTLDAGYYDEHGVELAATWIWTNREWLQRETSGVLLVQVPDARSRIQRRDAKEDRAGWWGAGMIGITGPIGAVRTAGSAAADYRNDQLIRFLKDTLNVGPNFNFETVAFEPDETAAATPPEGCARPRLEDWREDKRPFPDIALSWHLTSCEVRRLKLGIAGGPTSQSCHDRALLQEWWRPRGGTPLPPLQCPPPGSEHPQR